MFRAAGKVPSIPTRTEVRTIRGISRFEARADVEALMHLFADERHGLGPESRGMRSRHLSVSSMMEQHAGSKEEDHETHDGDEWRKALNDRLGGIERALLALSKSAIKK
jgi:hypothetical protein